jgi:hypothetical protein
MKKALPLHTQFAALAALWATWILAVTWVQLRARANAAKGLYYDEDRFVYSLLFIDLPLVLVCSGLFFLFRVGRPGKLSFGHKILYLAIAGVTIVGIAVLLNWGIWAFGLTGPVRV